MLKELNYIMLEDEPLIASYSEEILKIMLGATATCITDNNNEVLRHIYEASILNKSIDFITTDINHKGENGIELLSSIRSLSSNMTISNCLRAKNIPLVVSSAVAQNNVYRDAIHKIDSNIKILVKPYDIEKLVLVVNDLLRSHRHAILKEMQGLGLSIFWKDGAFRIGSGFLAPIKMNTSLIFGNMQQVLDNYQKLIMVDWNWANANIAVGLFEEMINSNSTTESDFQDFFEKNPEFLMEGQYDSYWAEPILKSPITKERIRPDFILQPMSNREDILNWNIVELKKHNVNLISNKKFHAGLSRYVTKAINQLKDYKDFFQDPRHQEYLIKKFGGIAPSPKITMIIGRLPTKEIELFTNLKKRNQDFTIRTYDDILEFRKAHIERMAAFQSS